MTDLERKCNEYREYKRLAEQAEQMRDSLRDEIIAMMQGAPEVVAGACKVMYRTCRASGLIASFYRPYTRIFMPSAASAPHTSVLAWSEGVRQVIFSCILFIFYFFSALFKASK